MGRKILETLTESMFYVLMALLRQARCGTEIADFVAARTKSRVRLGPGTLYTILAEFEEGRADPGVRGGGPQAHLRPHGRGTGPLRGRACPPAELSGGRGGGEEGDGL